MTVRELLARLAGVLGRGRRDADLDEELALHREMLEARYRERGLDPAAARRAAALELGGAAQAAERWRDQRGLPLLDTLLQDVRYGLRMLRRTPGFTAAALATIALGIGANTAIFTIVDRVLLRPLPYREPERLVTVGDRNAEGFSANVGFASVVEWRARSRTIDAFAMMRSWMPTLIVNGEAERLDAVRVSWNYFDMLGIRPAIGRTFTADEDRPDHWRVVLLSDRLWRRRFNADPAVVGRTIVMNDREYRIAGVMPATFEPLDAVRYYNANAELWAPIGYDLAGDSSCFSCRHLRAFARLKPGVTLAQATAEMNAIREQMRHEHPDDFEAGSIAIVPLRDALTGSIKATLYVLLGAVVFVLLIACANVANLLLARSAARDAELTLRTALGASRGRIARQLLTESVLLSAGGAICGIGLALAAVRGLTQLAPVTLPRLDRIGVDGRVLAFTAVITVATGLLFGLLPAWRGGAAARRSLTIDRRGSVGGSSRARSVLVVVDLTLALVLLSGAGLMLRTILAMSGADPGFRADRIVSLQFSLVGQAYAEDPAVLAFQQRLLDALAGLPGVEAAAIADQIPFGGNYDCRGFHVNGRIKPNPQEDPCIERYGVSPGYVRLMNIPVLAGRDLSERDTAASQPVVLISQSTARAVFGDDSPIGAQVRMGDHARGPWRTIVGVVGDVHHADVTAPVTAAMYVPESQFTDSYLVALVKSTTVDPERLVAAARAAIRRLDPTVPVFDVATLPDLVAKAAAPQLFVMRLLACFAGIAVLMAAVGLYGVVSYGVSQRTREVGVRVALGAQRRDVLRLVLSSGLALAATGIGAGLLAASLATRLLATLMFGVSPIDPWTFTAAALVLAIVALLAHWVPVRRALRIDPASALRAE